MTPLDTSEFVEHAPLKHITHCFLPEKKLKVIGGSAYIHLNILQFDSQFIYRHFREVYHDKMIYILSSSKPDHTGFRAIGNM